MITLQQRQTLRRLAAPHYRVTARPGQEIRVTSGSLAAHFTNNMAGYAAVYMWLVTLTRNNNVVQSCTRVKEPDV